MYDVDTIVLKMTELLHDQTILNNLKKALFPQMLADKMDHLSAQVHQLTDQSAKKDARINELEKKVAALEIQADDTEQYSRRSNLRFQSMPESDAGEDTDCKIIQFINEKMRLDRPMVTADLERSHRLGPKMDRQEVRRVRHFIVRFANERVRDVVYKARFRLKHHNAQRPLERVFINEDLTSIRAALAAEARKLRKEDRISDTWTVNDHDKK